MSDVTGSLTVGSELTAGVITDEDTTTDGLSVAPTYQWQAADFVRGTYSNVANAIDSTFTLTQEHVGKYLKVQANYTDALGNNEAVFSVTPAAIVANNNNAPMFGQNNGQFVVENSNAGQIVYTADATDLDGEDITYTITSVNNTTSGFEYGLFTIDVKTGVVTTTGALDYEVKNLYKVVVTASDETGSIDKPILVAVRDEVAESSPTGSMFPVVKGYYFGTTGSDIVYLSSHFNSFVRGYGGDDHYVFGEHQTNDVDITDTGGNNVVYFDQGFKIAAARDDYGLVMSLENGKRIEIANASTFTFYLGNQLIASYSSLLSIIGDGYEVDTQIDTALFNKVAASDALKAFYYGDDKDNIISLGSNLDGSVRGYGGNDTYYISRFLKGDVDISDSGNNKIVFEEGVVATSIVSDFDFIVTLSTGARIAIANPSDYEYILGKDAIPLSPNEFFVAHSNGFSVGLNNIIGDDAHNNLNGTVGADYIVGKTFNDTISANSGDDIIDGGDDDDNLTGGAGADKFIYRFDSSKTDGQGFWIGNDGADLINDFSLFENDVILFSDMNVGSQSIDTVDKLRAGLQDEKFSVDFRSGGNIQFTFGTDIDADALNGISGIGELTIANAENVSGFSHFDINNNKTLDAEELFTNMYNHIVI